MQDTTTQKERIVRRIVILAAFIAAIFAFPAILYGAAKPVKTPTPSQSSQFAGAVSQALTTQATPIPPLIGKDYKISSSVTFENDTWVVIVIEYLKQTVEPGAIVLKKENGAYIAAGGPATSFGPSDLHNVPDSVVSYLGQKGYYHD